jgi:hypothetical protein
MHHSPKATAVTMRFNISSIRPDKARAFVGGFVVDALVFEFMGLVVVALCVIVLAVPSGRQSSGRVRNH